MNIQIKGIDTNGFPVDFETNLLEGTITQNGHCKFIYPESPESTQSQFIVIKKRSDSKKRYYIKDNFY